MPKQVQLTGGEHDRVVHAREVMGLWTKARQALKLYPPTHPSAQSGLDRFVQRARSALSLSGSLRFAVTDMALMVDGEPVTPREAPADENVARRLFRGGIRELMLDVSASPEECHQLGLLLHRLLADPQLDAANELSRAELSRVGFQAMNVLAEAWEAPEYLSRDALSVLDEMNRDVEELVSGLQAGPGQELLGFELSDGAAEAQELAHIELDESRARWDVDVFPVPPEDRDALREEVGAWGPDRLLRYLVDAALDGLAYAPEELTRPTVSWTLRQALENALAARDVALVHELMVRLRQELDLIEDERDEQLLREVDAWLGGGERIERLVEVTLGGGVGGAEALCNVLELLGPLGAAGGAAAFLRTGDKGLEERLLRHLAAHAADQAELLELMVQPAVRGSKARSVLFMVSRAVKDQALLERLLRSGCEHPDEQVKSYAGHLWRTMTAPGRLAAARDGLSAGGRDARLQALKTIADAGDREAVPALLEQADTPGFLERDREERQAWIEAIGQLGGGRAGEWLDRWCERSTWTVFKRDVLRETKAICQRVRDEMRERRRTERVAAHAQELSATTRRVGRPSEPGDPSRGASGRVPRPAPEP